MSDINPADGSVMLIPDINQAEQFLDQLARGETEFTFQTFDDSESKNLRKAKVLHGTLDLHADTLIRMNQSGAGIFVMVNHGDGVVHEGSKTCRCNNNVIAVRALFADADGAPIEPILARSPRSGCGCAGHRFGHGGQGR